MHNLNFRAIHRIERSGTLNVWNIFSIFARDCHVGTFFFVFIEWCARDQHVQCRGQLWAGHLWDLLLFPKSADHFLSFMLSLIVGDTGKGLTTGFLTVKRKASAHQSTTVVPSSSSSATSTVYSPSDKILSKLQLNVFTFPRSNLPSFLLLILVFSPMTDSPVASLITNPNIGSSKSTSGIISPLIKMVSLMDTF